MYHPLGVAATSRGASVLVLGSTRGRGPTAGTHSRPGWIIGLVAPQPRRPCSALSRLRRRADRIRKESELPSSQLSAAVQRNRITPRTLDRIVHRATSASRRTLDGRTYRCSSRNAAARPRAFTRARELHRSALSNGSGGAHPEFFFPA